MNEKTAVCAIGRLENAYAVEFVEHYKNLGFSKILICDNNHDGEEHFEDVLQDYINQGFVEIIDYRNQVRAQMRAYSECYARYGNKYDWILYVDFDEFLYLNGRYKTVSDYLKEFPDDCQAVLVNWLIMDDNDKVYYEDKPLMERFDRPMLPIDKPIQYSFPDNMHVKSFIRGGLDHVLFSGNPHTTDTPLVAYNANFHRCNNRPWQPMAYENALLKHFMTKSLQEWVENKLKRGTGDRPYEVFKKTYATRYFLVNNMTQEKMDYLESINKAQEN